MKLTVIGCWGAYPAKDEATSAYLLEKDGYSCLIDCGSGVLSRLQSFIGVKELDAVILSHYHNDHVADIGVLQYSWLVQNSLQETSDVLPVYGHSEDQTGFKQLTHQFTKGIAYDPEKELHIGPFQFTFLKTSHPVPCYAMRISDGNKSIVYTADTSYKEAFIPFSRKADLLITDCNFYDGQNGTKAGHMTSKQGAQIAAEAQVKQLLLSHLPHFGNHEELVAQAGATFQGDIQLAHEGWVWHG
ncbi:MBL fold metallo-hydrolase [Sediminibacillus albus]|uniref:Ribonuclease BN, tRNA processing enzyme n=1 Tax=Sediminibacillus albus TaxID=407036 RepID=A0A1G8XER7_9BACI|nr:MBL fold metallo-hydrolase [Sediminibacillus albus]SDJ88270.1 Ribonuclease BN, tRNA processing enzyme [Sediminibacillus albus]